jgi:hypothetical protein
MTVHDLADWLRRYGNAWKARDPDAAVALFSAGATYCETPFDQPMVGSRAIHQYWAQGAQQRQRDVRFEATPIVVENDRGFAYWRASFYRVPSGVFVEVDGVLSVRFDEAQRCVEFREWWHRREQEPAIEPPKEIYASLR